ncbi:MAG TPA: hypothetical protein VLA21_10970 [Candidatus Limnocylindria bacterium]|nr:hypothetical protein [Candidatus Limnocylindria bacterium]
MRADLFAPPLPGLFIVLGAMGSGKTEFSVNLALSFAARGANTALADLDVVNPYFRSRGQGDVLLEHGVRLVAPPGALLESDLPVIPAEAYALVQDETLAAVLDVGGGRTGARVLGMFAPQIARRAPAVYYVLNRSRRENGTPARVLASLAEIGAVSGLSVTGIVHNTHLLGYTTPGTVLEGAETAAEVSRLTGIPVVCHAVREDLLLSLPTLSPAFPMRPRLSRPWEDAGI